MTYSTSVSLLIIFNGVGIPARMLAGHVADRYFGVLNTFIPIVFVNAILAYCWLAVTTQASLYAFVAIYGLFSAGFQSLMPTTVASLTPDIRKTGTRLGMVFSVISVASLTGPPIGGALLTTDGGKYTAPIIWAATSMLVGVCLIVGARAHRYGRSMVKC